MKTVTKIEDEYSAFIKKISNEISKTYDLKINDVNQFLEKHGIQNRKILAPYLIVCINFFQEKYTKRFRSHRVTQMKNYHIENCSLWLYKLNSIIEDDSFFIKSISNISVKEDLLNLKNYYTDELKWWENKRGGSTLLVYANLRPFIYNLLVQPNEKKFKKEIKDEKFVVDFIYDFFSEFQFNDFGKVIEEKTGRISDEKSQKENIKKFYVRKAMNERKLLKPLHESIQDVLSTNDKTLKLEKLSTIKHLQNEIYSNLEFPFHQTP